MGVGDDLSTRDCHSSKSAYRQAIYNSIGSILGGCCYIVSESLCGFFLFRFFLFFLFFFVFMVLPVRQ